VKRLALISALALVSSTAGATMLLLGAGGGSGGGGGGGPTQVYSCTGTDYGTTASVGSPDGDGYRTVTYSGEWQKIYLPNAGQTVSTGTTYTATLDFKNTGSATWVALIFGDSNIANRIVAVVRMSDGVITSTGASGGGSYSSSNSSTLASGQYRITLTGSSSAWGSSKAYINAYICSDSECNDSPASGTFLVNTSTCGITTP
jgi:hypothetical protein